jgi:hypothetical protein
MTARQRFQKRLAKLYRASSRPTGQCEKLPQFQHCKSTKVIFVKGVVLLIL